MKWEWCSWMRGRSDHRSLGGVMMPMLSPRAVSIGHRTKPIDSSGSYWSEKNVLLKEWQFMQGGGFLFYQEMMFERDLCKGMLMAMIVTVCSLYFVRTICSLYVQCINVEIPLV